MLRHFIPGTVCVLLSRKLLKPTYWWTGGLMAIIAKPSVWQMKWSVVRSLEWRILMLIFFSMDMTRKSYCLPVSWRILLRWMIMWGVCLKCSVAGLINRRVRILRFFRKRIPGMKWLSILWNLLIWTGKNIKDKSGRSIMYPPATVRCIICV